MKPVTAVIADDEPLLRAGLRAALEEAWPELTIVAEAANGSDAVHAVREHRPQLAFLDIEMPVMSGLEAARELKGAAHVVFVTAYDRYAIEAFERGAIDYILKPATAERLKATAERICERLESPPPSLESLVGEISRRIAAPEPPLQWLQASLGNTIRLINVEDVLYFQSDTKYTRVVTPELEALVKTPLRELASQLDASRFWQVHRATLVSVRAIESVTVDATGRREIAVRGRPERLEVSRTFSHLFKGS